MYGLSAIEAANGWSMTVLGASIVFSGLVALSIVISQLHKILDLWENRRWNGNRCGNNPDGSDAAEDNRNESVCHHPHVCPTDIREIAAIWTPLVDRLDSPFCLADLHGLARKHNFPHPHLTINRLRSEHILTPVGDCLFVWNLEDSEEE